MSNVKSEREALLEARIKTLEAAEAKLRHAGPVEQGWALLLQIIPGWLIAISVGVFITFHAFTYYMDLQLSLPATDLKKAQAALKDAEMRAKTASIGGVDTVTLATVKANLDKLRAEADRAKTEADAQTATEQNVSMRLAALKAELDGKEAEAMKARLAAEAATRREGGDTLEARAQRAKLVLTELEAAKHQAGAANNEATLKFGFNHTNATSEAFVRGYCQGNHFAAEIECPEKYITVQQIPSVLTASVEEAAPSAAPARATVSPDEYAIPSTTKPAFKCERASLPVDFVICASPRLVAAEARLEDAYNAAKAARGDSVRKAQIAWVKKFGMACGLDAKARPASDTIRALTPCIAEALENRIHELQGN